MSELSESEKEIIARMVDMELAGDLPVGGAVLASEVYISAMRSLQEKRETLLQRLVRLKG